MDMMKKTLCEGLPRLGLSLSEETADTLCAFGSAVVEQNKVMNLTAITEPDQVAKLHLLDSLSLLAVKDLKGKRIVDVGCGAGFPGVPVKIACPQAELTLLDSLGKRMQWLETILPQLGVEATCVTARAEEAVVSCRESYDVATSRAVARLNILLELTAPFVKVGGSLVAMKAKGAHEEFEASRSAIRQLSGADSLQTAKLFETTLKGTVNGEMIEENRTIITVNKKSSTPKMFPRKFAQIKKNPL